MEGRGAFYETAGCLRDVIQNHLFQIVALLAMEPPAQQGLRGGAQTRRPKSSRRCGRSSRDDVVRGQYDGYRNEPDVAKDSDVETFCALRLFIDSWRWAGRAVVPALGKVPARDRAEVLVELKAPPQRLFADSAPAPGRPITCASGSPRRPPSRSPRASSAPGKEFVGDQRELLLLEEQPGEESPYERLLGDAMNGDGALFTREDAVEAAWAVVDPVLNKHHRAHPYKPGTWGPKEADKLIAADGGWHNPESAPKM